MMKLIFWFSVLTLSYIYIFYGISIWLFNKFFRKKVNFDLENYDWPEVAFLIAAYNEEDVIREKLLNTLALNYPAEKLFIHVISDGSNDQTNTIIREFKEVKLHWLPERKGKIAAINRVLPLVSQPISIFSDANVMVNPEAVREMVKHYCIPVVGGVSGEKRVETLNGENASSTEGLYWKYESFLKKEDARLSTLVGAAGELFSIRTKLFVPVTKDTLLDDFMISMNIIEQGYKIAYEPKAYASESPSLNMAEEYKRKVRIGAGGLQSVLRLGHFLNPFLYGIVTFQYFVHRFSRWIIAPLLIPFVFISNAYLSQESEFYLLMFFAQLLFHLTALLGWFFERQNTRYKLLYIPFYFNFMHYCIVVGWVKYISGKQKVTWQKATRLATN
jgi:cellulose synthase/poly-beta-1,6-N-acetylglucosamine synthase-like glycosyltransferase